MNHPHENVSVLRQKTMALAQKHKQLIQQKTKHQQNRNIKAMNSYSEQIKKTKIVRKELIDKYELIKD